MAVSVPSCGHWCCAAGRSGHPVCRRGHADEELGLDYCPACDGALHAMEAPG